MNPLFPSFWQIISRFRLVNGSDTIRTRTSWRKGNF